MDLKIKMLHPDAKIPEYGTDGAACFDLHSIDGDYLCKEHPQEAFDTGVAFEIPEGWAMLVFPRSGLAFKENVRLSNCVAVIDQDFRGSVKVKLAMDNPREHSGYSVKPGDRIAQAMLVPVERVTFVQVEELSDTARGAGGFGSTGQ